MKAEVHHFLKAFLIQRGIKIHYPRQKLSENGNQADDDAYRQAEAGEEFMPAHGQQDGIGRCLLGALLLAGIYMLVHGGAAGRAKIRYDVGFILAMGANLAHIVYLLGKWIMPIIRQKKGIFNRSCGELGPMI